MTLQQLLRYSISLIFQKRICSMSTTVLGAFNYDEVYFHIPRIYCKDGFNISIQINNGNYCESKNGYRKFGYEWKKAEWGFPSQDDELLIESAEEPENLVGTVGSESIEVLQQLLDKHGGIDFDVTFSVEKLKDL